MALSPFRGSNPWEKYVFPGFLGSRQGQVKLGLFFPSSIEVFFYPDILLTDTWFLFGFFSQCYNLAFFSVN